MVLNCGHVLSSLFLGLDVLRGFFLEPVLALLGPWPMFPNAFSHVYIHIALAGVSFRMAFLAIIWVSERFPLRVCFLWVGSLLPFWFAHRRGRSSRHTMEGVGQGEVCFWSKVYLYFRWRVFRWRNFRWRVFRWRFFRWRAFRWRTFGYSNFCWGKPEMDNFPLKGLSNVPSSPLEGFSAARRVSYSITVGCRMWSASRLRCSWYLA